MPRHIHYVEPFFGGGAVLFARHPEDTRLWLPPHKGVSEVVNDINCRLVCFWRVLRDPVYFEMFRREVEAIPMSRVEWETAHDRRVIGHDGFKDAVAFFVDNRQSRAGAMKGFTTLTRTRLRRGMNGNVSEWLGAVEGLADVHERLRRVVIENMNALELIVREDSKDTFFYADPPYVHSTRTTNDHYENEMSDCQHERLVDILLGLKGKVILSGYRNQIYNRLTNHGWICDEIEIPNQMAGGKEKRIMTECLWMNY